MVVGEKRDIVCVLLFRRTERDRVLAEVKKVGAVFDWHDVEDEDRGLEANAWVSLTVEMAGDEALR
jgi:hypothetical protein